MCIKLAPKKEEEALIITILKVIKESLYFKISLHLFYDLN